MRKGFALTSLSGGMLILACAEPNPNRVVANHVATSDWLTITGDVSVALAGPEKVCLTDRHQFLILCGDPTWTDVDSVTIPEGDGPGEMRALGKLFRVADDESLIGAVDLKRRRAEVFEISSGTHTSGFPVPPLFRPIEDLRNGLIKGLFTDFKLGGNLADVHSSGWTTTDLSYAQEPEKATAADFLNGATLDDSTVVVQARGDLLAFVRRGRITETLRLPNAEATGEKSDYEAEQFVADMRRGFGLTVGPSDIEAFLERPRPEITQATRIRAGPLGTIWVALNRERSELPQLEVLTQDGLVGVVPIAERLIRFDLLGNRLVVLVESVSGDADIPLRRFLWYEVSIRESEVGH